MANRDALVIHPLPDFRNPRTLMHLFLVIVIAPEPALISV
jgi:hypothetical protein